MKKCLLILITVVLTLSGYAQSKLDAKYDFKAPMPDGKVLALSDLIGKTDYVLVDFWASWCGPCRYAIRELKQLYAKQPKGRLQILSCSTDNDDAKWRKALEQDQMPWPQIRERENYYCSYKYDVRYIPYLVLFDRQGNMVGRDISIKEVEEIISGK